jgi:hypothetical protein
MIRKIDIFIIIAFIISLSFVFNYLHRTNNILF